MNLFQQAMYRGKPQPQKNTAMTGDDIRNTMCERGLTGVKATALVHSGKWKNHKYLYIDSNGKYVYPEDVANKAKDKVSDTKNKISDAAKNLRTTIRDKQFKSGRYEKNYVKNHNYPNHEGDPWQQYSKDTQAMTRSHQGSTSHISGKDYFKLHQAGDDPAYTPGAKSVNKQKKNTAARKRQKLANQQQKSAHAGYERDKRIFPDGGSTEELENQKQKTKDRKFNGKTTRKSINQQLNNAHSVGRSEKWITEGKNMSTEELERQKELTKRRKKKASSYEPDYKSSKSTQDTTSIGEHVKTANKKKISKEDLAKAGAGAAIAGAKNKSVKKTAKDAAGKGVNKAVDTKSKRDDKLVKIYETNPERLTEEQQKEARSIINTRKYMASERGKLTEKEKRKRKNSKRTIQAERRRKKIGSGIAKAVLR